MLTISEINSFDRAAFTALLGHLFEHSRWVAEETWARRPFRDLAHLYGELCATMRSAEIPRQRAIIDAHPDLAGRLALAGQLTPESHREQQSAGLNQLGATEAAEFEKLNTAYRTRFGFPFIICARLNARDEILKAMRNRLGNSPADEHAAALAEIEKIAWLRLRDP